MQYVLQKPVLAHNMDIYIGMYIILRNIAKLSVIGLIKISYVNPNVIGTDLERVGS